MKRQTCIRCIMDNSSDSTISFDDKGVCNYCTTAYDKMNSIYFPNDQGKLKLDALITRLKADGKEKKYDCLMGISGGLDSAYLLYLGNQWGLRILAVHIDDGFDTAVSKRNLERLVKASNVEYIVYKPDSIQFNALTRAYIMAGVPNLAIPQDNVLAACLYKYARKYKIKHFLSGGNFSLESILQQGNTYRAYDIINIKAIHKRFGTEPLNKLPLINDYQRFIDQKFFKIKTHIPLDFIDYNRINSLKELSDFCGFEYYGSKHLENSLTKFIQVYWFYNKFGVDKRRSHLSSMIVSGQMTREKAMTELQKPLYDEKEMQQEIKVICDTLKVSEKEFNNVMKEEPKQHTDYPIDKFYLLFKKLFN